MGSPSGTISRQLIRVWIEKYETSGLDADALAADLLHEYETKIVALELMVGRQALRKATAVILHCYELFTFELSDCNLSMQIEQATTGTEWDIGVQ